MTTYFTFLWYKVPFWSSLQLSTAVITILKLSTPTYGRRRIYEAFYTFLPAADTFLKLSTPSQGHIQLSEALYNYLRRHRRISEAFYTFLRQPTVSKAFYTSPGP